MTKEEQKAKKREERSKFRTRLVDEFKKIVLIALFPLFSGVVIASVVLYACGIEPSIPASIPIAAMGFLSGAYFAYCTSATKEKDSLNKNGLIKDSDGVIKKAVSSVASFVSSVTSGAATATEDEDTEDSDETPISSCNSSDGGEK